MFITRRQLRDLEDRITALETRLKGYEGTSMNYYSHTPYSSSIYKSVHVTTVVKAILDHLNLRLTELPAVRAQVILEKKPK